MPDTFNPSSQEIATSWGKMEAVVLSTVCQARMPVDVDRKCRLRSRTRMP